MGSYVKLAKRAVETEMPIMVQVLIYYNLFWISGFLWFLSKHKDNYLSCARERASWREWGFVYAMDTNVGYVYMRANGGLDTGIGPRSEKCCVLGPGLSFPFLMFLYAAFFTLCKGIENRVSSSRKSLFSADFKDFSGVVYWQPPKQALNKVKELVWEPSISRYGADEGIPELREALTQKLQKENKLVKSSVMVTAGANQAFVNLVLALCDAGDSVVMFAPYYFNAYMSFQMTGVTNILVGPGNPETLHPDAEVMFITFGVELQGGVICCDRRKSMSMAADNIRVFEKEIYEIDVHLQKSHWLEKTLSEAKPVPKVVTVVNPGNPSGTYIPDPLLKRISDLCREAGSWLIVDNTYEYFMYDGLKHSCIEGDHVVNIFSFSKAYGMMGWRVGYIAYPSGVEGFQTQLLKIQDNIPICASILSQHLALYSLEMGPEWVTEQVKDLVKNRDVILEALSPLGEGAVKGGEGAIYLWAKLPEQYVDDDKVVRWLATRHGVVVIPGGACGCPGHLRISFGGLTENDCKAAAERLRRGLEDLVSNGIVE
ncbi:hypothetical protein POTOM_001444 [Populus tomentosa]|uniref:Aminotransferase class I/classII large domain-containing protein n=1 Tax=Populus tomentosa TaxID=118781 RepID=A0A8X8DHZ5_POPTO|nr:hypothetical protein POTOM_001444 [Populus tomentosa]